MEAQAVKKAAQMIRDSSHPVVLTGAGVSAESGIPTFRGEGGLWKNFRAEELATPRAFRNNPELVWEWYNWRRGIILSKKPNPAHHAIVSLQKQQQEPFAVITQNVDSLHTDAATERLVEMHGNIFRSRCTRCGKKVFEKKTTTNHPLCGCGELMRPDIVWFGESLEAGNVQSIYKELDLCDLLIVVGTSGLVYPAAGFAETVYSKGGQIIEVNPQPVIPYALALAEKAGEVLPLIAESHKTM